MNGYGHTSIVIAIAIIMSARALGIDHNYRAEYERTVCYPKKYAYI